MYKTYDEKDVPLLKDEIKFFDDFKKEYETKDDRTIKVENIFNYFQFNNQIEFNDRYKTIEWIYNLAKWNENSDKIRTSMTKLITTLRNIF